MTQAVLDHKCKNCGAELKFNPHGQNWKCDYCKSEFTKQEIDAYEALRGVEQLNSETKKVKIEKDFDGIDEYICNNCGAKVVTDEQTSATFCVYCKNTTIIKNKLVGEFNPNYLIPFYNTKEDAINAFKKITKKKFLAPKEFNDEKNIQDMRGIYIPFWLYDYSLSGDINAKATRIRSWVVGNTRYTKTDIYNCIRGGSVDFNKIPVDGSSRFDNDIMNSIEPFDYSALVEFSHSYLSGFLAEKYDVEAKKAETDAITRAKNSFDNQMKNDIKGYTSVSITNSNYDIIKSSNNYVLLPVWMLNIRYKDKMYTFAMNGQTGKMVGNIPINKNKAIIFGVILFIIVFGLLSLIWIIGGIF